MKDIKLSVVIPTRQGGKSLGDLLVSITRQQAAPPFEVLVVATAHEPKAEQMVKAFGSRFRYLCTNRRGVNVARNMGLGEARGEIALFLNDDCYLEEPLILKRHFEAHQKHPLAIGIGGRYALKRDANIFERTQYWISDYLLSRSKMDTERTLDLAGGNCSYKTVALRTTFRFNDEIPSGSAERELNARLVAAGQELILSERLPVESRVKLHVGTFLQNAFFQGLAAYRREQAGLTLHWRFQGERQTFAGNLEERGVRPTPILRRLHRFYDAAFHAGMHYGMRVPGATAAPGRIASELLREFFQRVSGSSRSATSRELIHALKFNISRR
jgi:glycosyltransferase involved in cell wall biosynthesis